MTNIILEKTYAKCGRETTPTPIPKNKIKHIFGSTAWNFIQFVFIVYPDWKVPKYIKTKVLTTCFYLTAWKVSAFGVILVRIFPYSVRMRENADQNNSEYEHFLRNASYKAFSLPASVSPWFFKKNISHVIFYQLIKFFPLIAFIPW